MSQIREKDMILKMEEKYIKFYMMFERRFKNLIKSIQ